MNERTKRLLIGAAISLAVLFVMVAAIRDTTPWREEGAGIPDELDGVVDGLFDPHVIAFEVLGILLTAAMIGALVIARPLGQAPDESHYSMPSAKELEASQRQSEPATHTREVGK
jgi:hypothetical protein